MNTPKSAICLYSTIFTSGGAHTKLIRSSRSLGYMEVIYIKFVRQKQALLLRSSLVECFSSGAIQNEIYFIFDSGHEILVRVLRLPSKRIRVGTATARTRAEVHVKPLQSPRSPTVTKTKNDNKRT